MKKLIISFFLLILINQTLAISSTNYDILYPTISIGGTNVTSTNYNNNIILGTISKTMSSGNYTLEIGYWFANEIVEGDDGGGSAVPDQPPEEVCESEWVCSSWSFCWTGVQERVCIDINNCEESIRPLEIRNCTIWESIKEKIKEGMCKLPSIWSICKDGKQSRTISEWKNNECIDIKEERDCKEIIAWSRIKLIWEQIKDFLKGNYYGIKERTEQAKEENRLKIIIEQINNFFRDLYYKIKWESVTTYNKIKN